MVISRRLATAICAGILTVVMTGCAEKGPPPTPEEAVRERAQAWADALLAKNLDAAYAMTTPGYRNYASVGQYHARVAGAGNWRKAEVTEVDCLEQACQVKVLVTHYIPQMKMESSTPLDYRWIEIDGEWWLYVPAG
jgi:hypothetical protein